MKTRISAIPLIIVILFLSSCNAGQVITPTLTPAPTSTPPPTATLIPTQISTPIPVSLAYNPVPRWMILGQPGYGVNILGEKWNYSGDSWGETVACISYTREKEPYVFFEQCFALTQPDLTFEIQRDAFVNDGFEALEPNNTFGDVGQISLMAKRLEDNSTKFIKFIEIVAVKEYILLVEMNVVTADSAPLQVIYENQAAGTITYVLQNSLEKSHLVPRPTATPLSPKQEVFYDLLAAKLINEAEANELYRDLAETSGLSSELSGLYGWEALSDEASPEQKRVCRAFEDRTNADVLWIGFLNCVYSVEDFPFEAIPSIFQQPGDTILESSHTYSGKLILFGYQEGNTYFEIFLLKGEFIYRVSLTSRTQFGDSVEDAFTKDVDDFLYRVLMKNAEK